MSDQLPPSQQKFGTFLGVYMPSVLTILGLIMYLRFGWVIGNVGLGYTLLIVVLASTITFITGLSASAIATNIQVGVGGEYFLISRSLGLEPGGAIGIPLYLCRTLSVTFYCFGLAEAILIFWPESWGIMPQYLLQGFTAVLIVLVTLLSGKSASLTLKAQLPIMILVGLSILALIIGVLSDGIHRPSFEATYASAPEGFWFVFAVFFPAVTGFAAGIGMSGDLKNPRKSIPIGTLGAVLTGVVIYVLIPVFLSITDRLSQSDLVDPNRGLENWTDVAFLGSVLILPAVWGAILSSAFGSILGGPRVLQALSMDGLVPKFLSRLSKTGQPTIATWVSGLIALAAVLLGELNTVARFISVLFLTLYVAINLSAVVEQLVAEPSYRPKVRVPWYVSLFGALGAIWVMYLISPIACVVALGLEILLYVWLRSNAFEQQWGDVTAGFWMNITRYGLLKLSKRKIHPRNWRPLMLLFVYNVENRIQLVKLAAFFGQDRGILTIAKLNLSGEPMSHQKRERMEAMMRETLHKHQIDAFCQVHATPSIERGILNLSTGHGLARLRTNTIVFGWSEEQSRQVEQLHLMEQLSKRQQSILLVRFTAPYAKEFKNIDIWWGGRENNGDLMLLLAYLLHLNPKWKKAALNVRSVVKSESERDRLQDGILEMLKTSRIRANVDILVSEQSFQSILHRVSGEADIVFMGMADFDGKGYEDRARMMNVLSSGLKATAFIQNNAMPESVPMLLKWT